MKANETTKGWEVSNHRRRKDKESDSIIDTSVHKIKSLTAKQLNGRNHHIPININSEC
jgi:hypothetical protein